jgi:hypothetical protein
MLKSSLMQTQVSAEKKKQFDRGFHSKNIVAQHKKIEDAKKAKESLASAKVYADFVRGISQSTPSVGPQPTSEINFAG